MKIRDAFLSPYSIFYFCFFAFHSVNRSFFPIHCRDALGFGEFEIALVTGAEDLANAFGPPLMMQLAHSRVTSRTLAIACSILAFLAFLPLFQFSAFTLVLLFWFLCLFATRAPIVLVEAAAIRDSARGLLNFGRVRIWGSFGFIGGTFGLGFLVDTVGVTSILTVGVFLLTLVVAASFYTGKALRGDLPVKEEESSDKFLKYLFCRDALPVWKFLLVVTLLWSSHAVLYTYFSLFLKDIGWSGTMISTAWGMGVAAELFVFYFFDNLEKRFSLVTMLRFCLLCALIRWSVLGSTTSTPLILLAQTLHSFSLIGFHVASMKLMFRLLPEPFKDRGQGLLAAVALGFGVFAGRLLAGFGATLLPEGTPLNVLFLGAAVFAGIAALLSFRLRVDMAA